jgi:hypothetical protein
MNSVKVLASKPYRDFLLQSLQNPEEASGYLLAALQDSATEPELLSAVLQNIEDALGNGCQDVGDMATLPIHQAMPQLMEWLDKLGLQITIAPKMSPHQV